MTYPDSTAITYEYLSTSDFHDDEASRVTRVKVGATVVASYLYLGASQLVGTGYDEVSVYSRRFDISDDYSTKLDRFNRPIEDTWSKNFSGTETHYFHNDIAWDRNSNITAVDDQVFPDQFVSYSMDDLNRLIDEQRRSASGGGGSLRFRNERTLSQVGNTTNDKLDLNGDTDQADTNEWNEGRGYNEVNELLGRDYDSGSFGYEDALVYSGRGEMTDDGKNNLLDYDYWGRPRKIKNKSNVVASEYRYNGLGWRISFSDEATSHTYHLVYDDRWRNIATYRDSDSDPKERMVYDNAGMTGYGSSSYIDSIVLRDKDANTAWTSASDGTLEERLYLLQNWRSDVVFVLEATGSGNGEQVEHVRYEAYGTPTTLPAGDTDRDGDTDASDVTQIDTWISGTTWDARGDLDFDNDVDAADKTLANGMSSANGGRGVLSDRGNRKGYAGYERDLYAVHDSWHLGAFTLNSILARLDTRKSFDLETTNLYLVVSGGGIVVDNDPHPDLVTHPSIIDPNQGNPCPHDYVKVSDTRVPTDGTVMSAVLLSHNPSVFGANMTITGYGYLVQRWKRVCRTSRTCGNCSSSECTFEAKYVTSINFAYKQDGVTIGLTIGREESHGATHPLQGVEDKERILFVYQGGRQPHYRSISTRNGAIRRDKWTALKTYYLNEWAEVLCERPCTRPSAPESEQP